MATISYKSSSYLYGSPSPFGKAYLEFDTGTPNSSSVVYFGQDTGEFTTSIETATFIPVLGRPGTPGVGKLYIDGELVAGGVYYTWTVIDGATIEWTDETTCRITTSGGGGTMLDVTYNSQKIIDSLEVTPPVTVTYNGSTIATLNAGDTKTLSCSGKVMASDVSIGSKVLKCNGLLATSDIEVSLSGALPYLAFKAISAGTTVSMKSLNIVPNVDLEYSFDMRSWTPFVVDVTEVSIPNGSTLYLRGNNETISTGRQNYIKFVMAGSIEASGSVQSLLDKTCKKTDVPNYCFNSLFTGCSSLQNTPELPATTLGDYCYYGMFRSCQSLTKPSHLVATVLPNYCYGSMFENCSSILLSKTQGSIYQTPYRIPTSGTGSAASDSLNNMFRLTGGSFVTTPSINTTYYGAW